jgi:hypothetical protein
MLWLAAGDPVWAGALGSGASVGLVVAAGAVHATAVAPRVPASINVSRMRFNMWGKPPL